MKQSWLNSLKGLTQDQAIALVEADGLEAMMLPYDMMISQVLRSNTVILWMSDDDEVYAAGSGGDEVEDDECLY